MHILVANSNLLYSELISTWLQKRLAGNKINTIKYHFQANEFFAHSPPDINIWEDQIFFQYLSQAPLNRKNQINKFRTKEIIHIITIDHNRADTSGTSFK